MAPFEVFESDRTPTLVGDDVVAHLGFGVTAVFENVTVAGGTTLGVVEGERDVPPGYTLGTPGLLYTIETTAAHTGAITLTINHTGMEFREPAEVRLVRILDDESKAGESDAATPSGEPVGAVTTIVDAESELIQGRVSALSTFALVEPRQATASISVGWMIAILLGGAVLVVLALSYRRAGRARAGSGDS